MLTSRSASHRTRSSNTHPNSVVRDLGLPRGGIVTFASISDTWTGTSSHFFISANLAEASESHDAAPDASDPTYGENQWCDLMCA